MRKHILTNFIVLLTLFLTFAACKKSSDSSITTDDQGTFEVKVNGEWLSPCLPSGASSGPINSYYLPYPPNDFLLTIIEKNECDPYYTVGRSFSIYFDSVQIHENTTYSFGDARPGQIHCGYYIAAHYLSYNGLPGTITISKFDSTTRQIAGSFEGTLKNINTGNTVSLTEGKFDLKY